MGKFVQWKKPEWMDHENFRIQTGRKFFSNEEKQGESNGVKIIFKKILIM